MYSIFENHEKLPRSWFYLNDWIFSWDVNKWGRRRKRLMEGRVERKKIWKEKICWMIGKDQVIHWTGAKALLCGWCLNIFSIKFYTVLFIYYFEIVWRKKRKIKLAVKLKSKWWIICEIFYSNKESSLRETSWHINVVNFCCYVANH